MSNRERVEDALRYATLGLYATGMGGGIHRQHLIRRVSEVIQAIGLTDLTLALELLQRLPAKFSSHRDFGYGILVELWAGKDSEQALDICALITNAALRADAFLAVAVANQAIDPVFAFGVIERAIGCFTDEPESKPSVTWSLVNGHPSFRLCDATSPQEQHAHWLMANADRLQARHAPVAVDLLERALGDITAHKHIEERAKELSDIATRFSKLLGVEPLASRYGALFKPKALAALQHEAKRARAKAEHDCAVNRLLEDAQVQRPEDDAERVRKKARRYRKNAATRLVFVGEGDDFAELEHGFEVVRTIEAVLRHQSILDELEIRLMDIRALTADLPHLKKLRCAPEEYPDLLGELERLELVECRSRFWDGGFPGLSGFWVKVYINALVYESLIGELWTLHARLCNLIRCRLEEKPVKDV